MSSAPSDRLPTPSGQAELEPLPATVAEVKKIAGLRYQILRPHDRGGIGEVFVALDQELNREVALKEIQERHAADAHSLGRFVREAEITGGLEHPGIVPVYGLGQYADGRPFYAMRFIQGETLKDAIARHHRSGEGRSRSPSFELRSLLTRFVAVCNTIAYAHSRGVIHRDLKPSNIMLGKYGETLVVDWGMAKAGVYEPTRSVSEGLPEPTLVPSLVDGIETQAGEAMGTPAYMSPEQASGRLDLLGPASDIYSLGATLYTLLTGRPPIEGKDTAELLRRAQRGEWLPVHQVRTDVPPALAAICHKAMALAPAARYSTALDLAADVEHWLADEPVAAYRESWLGRSRRWMRRHRTLVSTAVGVLLVALVGLTVGLLIVSEAERKETAARKTAEAQKEEARFNQYVAEMNLVQREYEADNFDRVRELLAAQAPREAGETDFRHFEWRYWQNMARRELLALKGHLSAIFDVAFSPDGRRLASASSDQSRGTVRIWDAATGKELLVLKVADQPGSGVSQVVFSPDGRRLATVCGGEVRIWDSATGQKLLATEGHSVAFSPDGRRLALKSNGVLRASNAALRVLDLPTGKELFVTKGDHPFSFSGVVFSPDGRRLALGTRGRGPLGATVRVLDTATGKELLTLKGHKFGYDGPAVVFSPDGRRLASSGAEGTVRIWDAATGQELAVLDLRTGGTIRIISPTTGRPLPTLKEITYAGEINVLDNPVGAAGMVFSPDGRRLATFGWKQIARIWDAATGKELLSFAGRSATTQGAAFSPDGRQLATVGEGTVQVWDAATGRELFAFTGQKDLPGRRHAVVFSPDGRRLAAAGPHRTVRVWDVASGPTLLSVYGFHYVTFSPNGQQLACGGTVRVFDAVTGQMLLALKGPRGDVWSNSVAFSPDGRRLATVNLDHTVHVWSVPDGKDLLTFKGHTDGVWTVAFSPDGRRLASAGLDPTVRVWDAATGQELLTLQGHTRGVWTVAFSPDGRRLASASYDGTVRVWDAASGQELRTLKGHTGSVWGVAFSPDSRRLASAGADQTVRVWDAASGQELLTLKGHTDLVGSVAFSPDGRRLASASWDKTVRLWDASTGRELLALKGHTSNVMSVAFSPDGQRLAAAADAGNILVWEASPVPDELWRRRLLVNRISSLWSKLLLREEVLAALRADPTLGEAERDFALQAAQAAAPPFPISLSALNDAAWKVVKSPDAAKDEYVRALHQAEEGVRLAPEDGFVLNTLGAAQYRLGRYAEALATLTKSEKLNAARKAPQPADLAFLAMTLHQLGQKNEAKATLDRLRQLLKQPRRVKDRFDDSDAAAGLHECRRLIEGAYRIPGALEGEKLKVLRQSSNFDLGPQSMSRFPASQWSGDAHLLAEPPKGGGWADLELPVSEAGRHEVIVYLTKAPDCGIVQFRLDGQALGKPIDCFEPETVISTGPLSLGTVELKKGPAVLRVECIGSNPRSVGQRTLWGLDCIVLKPVKP